MVNNDYTIIIIIIILIILKILGPNFRRMRLAQRQTILKEQYHFDCKCCICMDPTKDYNFFKVIEGLVCLTCRREIPATLSDLEDNETVDCNSCQKQFKTLDYKRRISKADRTYAKGKKCISIKFYSLLAEPVHFAAH